MSSARIRSASHSPVWMFHSIVREAFDTSVTCRRPRVSCQTSQLSMVPKASSPRAARSRPPSTWSRIQRSLVAEKYGSMIRPVRLRTSSSRPSARRLSQMASVRRSCQTMALKIGLPVARSHTMVVSRWLVMPSAAMSAAESLACSSAARQVASWLFQMSNGSCSTQPGCGKCCGNSCWALATIWPARLKTMARELDVPWSSARRYSIRQKRVTAGHDQPAPRHVKRMQAW